MTAAPLLGLFLASAQPVAVSVVDCPGLSAATVERILALELRAHTRAAPAQLSARCEGSEVALSLAVPGGATAVRRLKPGASEPRVLERLIALTGAEMMAEPVRPPPPPVPEVVAPAPPPPVPSYWQTEVSAAFRSFPQGRLATWGVRASLTRSFGERTSAGFEAEFGQGSVTTAPGSVKATLWSLALPLRLRQTFAERFALEEGVALAGGHAQVSGEASLQSLWWGGSAELGVAWSPVRALRLRAGVELGYALKGVSGEVPGEAPVQASGLWVAGTLGVGYAWL